MPARTKSKYMNRIIKGQSVTYGFALVCPFCQIVFVQGQKCETQDECIFNLVWNVVSPFPCDKDQNNLTWNSSGDYILII